jgi:hypothetical protein
MKRNLQWSLIYIVHSHKDTNVSENSRKFGALFIGFSEGGELFLISVQILWRNFQLFPDNIQDFHEINERFGLFFEFSISLEMVDIVRLQILQISEKFIKCTFVFPNSHPT